MPFRICIRFIQMSDGTIVEVPPGGTVVFVGPNNSGKSLSLRNIRDHLIGHVPPVSAVIGIELFRDGGETELKQWLDAQAQKQLADDGQEMYYRRGSSLAYFINLRNAWLRGGNSLGPLADLLLFYANSESRLNAAQPAANFNALVERPTHPLQFLYMDPSLEAKLNELCKKGFGTGLVVDRFAGNVIALRVGEQPPMTGPSPSIKYLEALRALPPLQDQGDGMKSFMGLLLHLVIVDDFFVLVDEAEAFLHPPQAQLLGRVLATEKGPNTQLFVATHSIDVIKGLLDAQVGEMKIVRLVREDDANRASQLEPEVIRELWSDPVLRYSNILDGLFHHAVILCESDSDCRYYASVLDAMLDQGAIAQRPELFFTHCGGKHRMPTVIAALRAVDVPVRVVVDFDVLREEQPLRAMVERLGGSWAALRDDWRKVKISLDRSTTPTKVYVREEIEKLLGADPEARLTLSDSDAIRKLTKAESGWDKAKQSGKSAIDQGDASASCENLLKQLRRLSIFVVEVGELERFVPTIGGHGPAWVTAVHEQGLHADATLTAPRNFVRDIVESTVP